MEPLAGGCEYLRIIAAMSSPTDDHLRNVEVARSSASEHTGRATMSSAVACEHIRNVGAAFLGVCQNIGRAEVASAGACEHTRNNEAAFLGVYEHKGIAVRPGACQISRNDPGYRGAGYGDTCPEVVGRRSPISVGRGSLEASLGHADADHARTEQHEHFVAVLVPTPTSYPVFRLVLFASIPAS
jgi:hypothetical protein